MARIAHHARSAPTPNADDLFRISRHVKPFRLIVNCKDKTRILTGPVLIIANQVYLGQSFTAAILLNDSQYLLRNATEITSQSDWSYHPYSVLRQQLHSRAMRLLSRLEYERTFGARSGSYFVRIPYGLITVVYSEQRYLREKFHYGEERLTIQ
jgi:hypothetical protein